MATLADLAMKSGVPSSVIRKIPRFDTATAALQHTGYAPSFLRRVLEATRWHLRSKLRQDVEGAGSLLEASGQIMAQSAVEEPLIFSITYNSEA